MTPENSSALPTDQEVEDFFEALTGRQEKHPLGKALREALKHDAQIIEEAQIASLDDFNEQDAAQMEALRQSLVSQGILAAPSPPSVASSSPVSRLSPKGPKP